MNKDEVVPAADVKAEAAPATSSGAPSQSAGVVPVSTAAPFAPAAGTDPVRGSAQTAAVSEVGKRRPS